MKTALFRCLAFAVLVTASVVPLAAQAADASDSSVLVTSPILIGSSAPESALMSSAAVPMDKAGPRKNLIMMGIGVSFGYFNPADVNRYLEDWVASLGAYAEEGFSSMVLTIVPRITFTYAPIEYIQLELMGEVGWGPKLFMFSDGSSEFFDFNRYSGGATLKGHIPVGRRGKGAIFLGGGVQYDRLSFEDYSAGCLGYRADAGYRISMTRSAIDIFLAGLYSKAESDFDASLSPAEMDLDYTSIMIGMTWHFMLNQ